MRFGTITMLAGVAVMMASALPMRTWAAEHDAATAAQVQAAKTAADHEALAAEYDKAAAAAKAEAADHRKMGEAYKGAVATSGGKVAGASAMPQHCDMLAKSFDQQAEMYAAMAATERELAKAAK